MMTTDLPAKTYRRSEFEAPVTEVLRTEYPVTSVVAVWEFPDKSTVGVRAIGPAERRRCVGYDAALTCRLGSSWPWPRRGSLADQVVWRWGLDH